MEKSYLVAIRSWMEDDILQSWHCYEAFETQEEAVDCICKYYMNLLKDYNFNVEIEKDIEDENHFIATWYADGERGKYEFIIIDSLGVIK